MKGWHVIAMETQPQICLILISRDVLMRAVLFSFHLVREHSNASKINAQISAAFHKDGAQRDAAAPGPSDCTPNHINAGTKQLLMPGNDGRNKSSGVIKNPPLWYQTCVLSVDSR